MRVLVLVLLSCLLPPCAAMANGTPIDASMLFGTGNISMIEQRNVILEEEDLRIVLDGDYADVRAAYRLRNRAGKTKVTYGFPVDYWNCNDCDEPEEPKGKPIDHVQFKVDGMAQKFYQQGERNTPDAKNPGEYQRTWIIGEIELDAGQQRELIVSYRARNKFIDAYWSTNALPQFDQRSFRYVVSPSGNWGDGVVGMFTITIDTSRITQRSGKVVAIAPSGYTIAKDVIRWQYRNFNLKEADDLTVSYDDAARLTSSFIDDNRLRSVPVRASSLLEDRAGDTRYVPAALLDGNLDTAWCEGATGPGTGQSLTFDFPDDKIITGIGVINGYTKNEDTYRNNGRVKRITILRDGRDDRSVELPSRDFLDLDRETVAPFVDWIADSWCCEATKRLTLVIEDVVLGAQYADTCIAEVFLLQ